MALNAVEQVSEQVPADDFQALEEKVYRTIEMFKAAREGQANAERDSQRLRQQLEDREEELVRLRRETVQLKKERGHPKPGRKDAGADRIARRSQLAQPFCTLTHFSGRTLNGDSDQRSRYQGRPERQRAG